MTDITASGIPSGTLLTRDVVQPVDAGTASGIPSGHARAAPVLQHPDDRLKDSLLRRADDVERALDALMPPVPGHEARLIEAMRYAALGGGKRLRGYLVMEVAALFDASAAGAANFESRAAGAARAAAAVEMLHAYSLVHDDLPAMDDDDLRRGQPSTHIRFDEATAILAGDALQTLAFATLADPLTHPDASVRIALVAALADAAGAAGMVGGQMIDMEGEGRSLGLDETRHLHALKTGRLIRYGAEAGAILGGADAVQRQAIADYGCHLGAAFQVADDVLDATGTAEQLGKTAGKDAEAGKSTFVALLGIDGARAEAERLAARADAALDGFGHEADRLRALARYVVERRN